MAKQTRSKSKAILRLLEDTYGPREFPGPQCAVDVLVGTILSQNTSNRNSSVGFAQLKRRFRTWDAVADAPTSSIAAAIRACGLNRTKAPRIKGILRRIRQTRGRIDLEFLRDLPTGRAYEYLLQFSGVGPKTALCVLMFAFSKEVLPVDTHVYRVTRRLGLLPDSASKATAHKVLTPLIAPANRYALHVLLVAHGRRICLAHCPRCVECCLLKVCSCRRDRTSGKAPARKRTARPPGGTNHVLSTV